MLPGQPNRADAPPGGTVGLAAIGCKDGLGADVCAVGAISGGEMSNGTCARTVETASPSAAAKTTL